MPDLLGEVDADQGHDRYRDRPDQPVAWVCGRTDWCTSFPELLLGKNEHVEDRHERSAHVDEAVDDSNGHPHVLLAAEVHAGCAREHAVNTDDAC